MYSETSEQNANLEFNSIHFDSDRKVRGKLAFFKFLMFLFDRIELATYSNKPLDTVVIKAKEDLYSNSVRSNHTKFEKNAKKN